MLLRTGLNPELHYNPGVLTNGTMLPMVVFALALAQAEVIDGDTLRDGAGERYRVENIDAPERGGRAECPEERALAEASRAYLDSWIAGADRVEALPSGRRDRYGRVVARIEIDGVDLARAYRARPRSALARPEGRLLLRRLVTASRSMRLQPPLRWLDARSDRSA